MNKTTFELTRNHIKLLMNMYVVRSLQGGYAGSPAIDDKRPYGNGSVYQDVAEILGMDIDDYCGITTPQLEVCEKIHAETPTALQIVLVTGAFDAGVYKRSEYSIDWVKYEPAKGNNNE